MKYLDISLPHLVDEAARRAAARYKTTDLEDYWARLSRVDPEDIWQKLADQPNTKWNGAVPVNEPAGISQASSADPKRVIAIDGSQINPDPDMPCRWAYVQAVAVGTQEQGLHKTDFVDFDSLLSKEVTRQDLSWLVDAHLSSIDAFVDYLRTILELDLCVEACNKYTDRVILWDHPMMPLGAGANKDLLRGEFDKRIRAMSGSTIAGLISGPRSHLLADLIALSEAGSPRQAMKARYLVEDSTLIRHGIPVGHRSAVFRYGTPFDEKAKYTGIYFFYIRVTKEEVVRIELPEWIGKDPAKIDEIHATVMKDSIGLGYSLTLLSAHHAVVITLSLGQELNLRAWSTYIANGGRNYLPAKLLAKRR